MCFMGCFTAGYAGSQRLARATVVTAALVLLALSAPVGARGPLPATETGPATIALSELPRQGKETYRQIFKGGPFPYDKDGSVFGNRERLLPLEKRGYYREYTVKTPWVRHRGARRIVCGGQQPTQPDVCFYTHDHYASFKQIIR